MSDLLGRAQLADISREDAMRGHKRELCRCSCLTGVVDTHCWSFPYSLSKSLSTCGKKRWKSAQSHRSRARSRNYLWEALQLERGLRFKNKPSFVLQSPHYLPPRYSIPATAPSDEMLHLELWSKQLELRNSLLLMLHQ